MSQTVITTAFEQWKAAQAANGQAVVLDEFVFANVPGLDVNAPINRAEVVPPAAQIVYRQAVEKTGLVNQNAVVYSVTLGADVGDFAFNWIGLINKATGKLAMVVHAPLQSKVKNANGQQGNVLTRSFLMEYNGAEAQTLISTPAESWQIDFTARLAGMDESLRLANLDIYGAGAFFDNGFLVAKTGTQYYVTAGLGYVGGLRANLAAKTNITVTTKPMKVWADVSYHGTLTSEYKTDIKFTLATALKDYVQSGIAHYVFALASIDANGVITDLRPQGSSQYLRRDKNLTDISDPEAALNTLNGVPKTRKINKKALSDDFDLTAADVGALPVIPGVLGTININTLNLAKIGVYVQSTGANATVANGYPPGAQAAGVLEVIPASWTGGVLQRYTVQNTGMVWTRALNASWNGTDGPWRDWVQASAVNSVTVPSAFLTTTDINTLGFASGAGSAALYAQPKNANATAALHYPQGIAGTLYVTPSAYGCQQMYITFTGNIWNRGLSGDWNGVDGPWKDWVPTYSANNKPTAADVGAWTAAQSAASEKALADEIGTAFKIRANLTATDSPNTLRGSAMFGHYGVPGAAAATTDKGYPMNGFVGVIFVTWGPNATQQIAFNNNGRQFTRGASGAWNGVDGPWTAWNEIYCQANKPTPADVGALPAGGTAVAATKLATARKIAGVAFDGTKDIGLNADDVGAFPRVGGDVNGRVTANYLRAITIPHPGDGQGTYLGWNESGGQGESDFVNNRGGGVGGFLFRTVNQANSVQTGFVRFTGTGDLATQGSISAEGGGIYEMGQRVFSPNNRQPVNSNTANLGGGWWRCGDTGMIKQWGVVNKGSRGWSTVNFPIPFPSACVNVQVTAINGGGGTFNDNFGTAQIINNIGFTCGQDSGGSYWEATGW
jgi:hypothetical protein